MAVWKESRSKDSRPLPRQAKAGKTLSDRTLASVVGKETYAVWVAMLRSLIPHGRTHRLAVVVASMLQYATDQSFKKYRAKPPQDSVAELLLFSSEEVDPDNVSNKLSDIVKQLFCDARVSPERVSAHGEEYSIVDSVVHEYIAWENMPWE